jgi:hypothetical protein
MNDRLLKLLEVYELTEIIELLDLEPYDVLVILDDLGLLDNLNIPEPL